MIRVEEFKRFMRGELYGTTKFHLAGLKGLVWVGYLSLGLFLNCF